METRCPRPPLPGETREEFVQAMTEALARRCRVRVAHRLAFDAWDEHQRDLAAERREIEAEVSDAERGG